MHAELIPSVRPADGKCLYEIESMRHFAGFSGVTDALPDETTILNFRHLLEKHELTAGCWRKSICT
ncbi:transposase [Nitrosovibrio sp. Nv4]|uniref:transposase n=1 Tax=Nitrosovibrio sp. Nv4 TaxID=1945880 RepID=UPI003511A3F6